MRLRILFSLLLLATGLRAHGQQANVDSLKKALTLVKEDTMKVAILSELSFACANSSPDTAMQYVAQQKAITDRLNIPKYTANALNDLATVLYFKGNYADALANNKKALAIREHIGDKALIVSSLNKIAVLYQEQGNFEKATPYQLRVLQLARELKNERYIGLTLNNISYLYEKVKQYDAALSYSRQALGMAENQHDTVLMASAYESIENLFEKKKEGDSALYYQTKAINALKQTNSLVQLAEAYNNMAYLYRLQKKDGLGVQYYKKARDIAAALNNLTDVQFYSANIGSVYIALKQTDSAYKYLQTLYTLPATNTKPSTLKTFYNNLSLYYTLKNQHDSAFYYNNLTHDITDTIYSTELAGQVNELLAKYETEHKEQQIALLNEQNTIKQLTIDRKNITIGVIAGSLILVVILSGLFYNRYRLKQAAVLQQEIIRQQQLASKAVIAAEELERQRIAHDLHDGIGQMFSAVKMNLSGIAHRMNIQEEDERLLMDKTMALVDESCKEVRVISHQMMPNVLLKSGLSTAIRDFIDKIDEHSLKVTLETFGLQQPLDSNVETVLYRVVQESVNNVIRHARASRLDIQLHKDEESITVTIEDNGSGFDPALVNSDKGIGLKNIKARVAFLNGKVDYDTAPGRGTLIAIYIPNKS